MINVILLVEDYCQACPHFTPCTDDYRYYNDQMVCSHDVTVMCKHKEQCGYLVNHLSKKDGGR